LPKNSRFLEEGFDYDAKAPASSATAPSTLFYIYVDDVEAVYKKALEAGLTSQQAPQITFWGDLRARLRCPFGYIWDIAQRV